MYLPIKPKTTLRNSTMYWTILLLAATTVEASLLRGDRRLQPDGFRDFVPLSCNSGLATQPCTPWTTHIGTETSHDSMVTIDCGVCVTMDIATTETLSLLGGLDIRGKLVFPDNYSLNLEATVIIVQGELEMTASKPVDGEPSLTFTMIGEDDLFFEPFDNNEGACLGKPCAIGKKGITVAGGKVSLNGLPSATPTWVHLYDVVGTSQSVDAIVIEDSVIDKWSEGAEILITSHTRVWNEQQVRTIKSVAPAESGYVRVELDSSIVRPTTWKDSQDFAVEVALLSRNIKFMGGYDSNPDHGGHFMVMHTPDVDQRVEGVEVRNFGQQGNLGRYPIHFHFCAMSNASVIAKNTIRESNQRCVVVHGTDFLRITENVAFDTAGHCFLTEDGMEKSNQFTRNLAAQTSIPKKIIPNYGLNGDETDHEPASFWITNPNNYFEGNVAAGSENSGFWFEPLLRGERAHWYPELDPIEEPLPLFKDNVAHSNVGKTGAIRMYTPGYRPKETAFMDGNKVYRNDASGIFIHRCQNIVVRDSLFADNNIGVDIDRAEGITVQNTKIIGESDSYRSLMTAQSVSPVCRQRKVTGVDLHTWKKETSYAGALIDSVEISGFSNTACPNPASVRFDTHTLKDGIFEFYAKFNAAVIHDGPDSIDMCIIEEREEFDMVFLIDSDGSMSPSGVVATGPSTLISDSPELLEFVDESECTEVPAGCYQYCADTCFRSMRYEVENGESYKLKVCSPYDYSSCVLFPGGRRGNNGPFTFLAHVPVGKEYNAVLVNSAGQEVTGAVVTEIVEESYCRSSDPFQVTLFDSLPPEIPTPVQIETSPNPPTPSPTRSPTSPPTQSPTMPMPTPGECFSGSSVVHVQGQGPTRMEELKIGDAVMGANNGYSVVHGFYHRDDSAEADFFSIETNRTMKPLEMTGNHLLFVNHTAIPAKQVQVGDLLGNAVVTAVSMVKRKGVYSPATFAGSILVNGVLASTYTSQLDSVSFNQHTAVHVVLSYHRLICWYHLDYCKQETYSEEGLSRMNLPLIRLVHKINECSATVQVLSALVLLPMFSLVFLVEQAIPILSQPVYQSLLLLGLVVWTKRRRDRQSQKTKTA